MRGFSARFMCSSILRKRSAVILKKLTEEKLAQILETGIAEFALHGPERANLNTIARKAGISVGVLYKYYQNKEAFFQTCLKYSLNALVEELDKVTGSEQKILSYARSIIQLVQRHSREHRDYVKMYLKITADANGEYADLLAAEIEEISVRLYTQFIDLAKKNGDIRQDVDIRLFAFFFDNLLMIMQFSYCCDYYRKRFRLYGGENILEQDELVAEELLKFLESAFTTEHSSILHTDGGTGL